MEEYTPEQIAAMKERIDQMTRFEMASLWRHAPAGHPYFRSDLGIGQYFDKRFNELGGFSPGISKALS